MDKRPHQDDELDASHLKRMRTSDIATNGVVRTTHDVSPLLAHRDYTIAWICALPLELAASRAMLDEKHQLLPSQPGDDNTYVLGRIGQHNVVMVGLPGQYGTNNAAIVATNLNRSFLGIRATLMVGIGGGAPGEADLHLGDVVVGTRVMQYDMGKDVGDGRFQMTADPKIPSRCLLSAVTTVRANHERDASSARVTALLRTRLSSHPRPTQPDRLFQASYEHPLGAPTCGSCDPKRLEPRRVRVSDEPKVHYGAIASGNKVMRNAKARDDIAQQFSVLCFEMEAAGLMDSQCLPIRGICDYSDSHKNKDWQGYAAATAAAYARELLEALQPAFGKPGRANPWFSTASKPNIADRQALERRKQLLESLDFTQIDARKTTIRAAHTKTCRWFLRHPRYQDWLDPGKQSQNHGFMWMRGKAGAGKSTMMKFVYLETKKKSKNPTTAVASFFFNARGDYLEKSVAGMYRSLLTQLLNMFPDLQSVLDDTDIVPWNQRDCPDLNALKELLRSAVMALGQRSFTCFIDALDECDEQEVRDMVQFFEELAETTTDDGIQLRICFSSRPYPYIDIRPEVLLTLEEEPGHAEDLAQYAKSHLRIANLSLLAELQAKILEKAAGIFMWIVLVVEILNKESCHGALALRRRLEEIPAKLSDLFKSILTRDQDRVERLLLCVLWVLCAKRPLSPAEFRHALWAGLLEQEQDRPDPELPVHTDMDAVKLVTSSSKGLVEITKSNQPTVQFIHESVRDFLVKENGLRDLWPGLGFEWEGRSHERLKRCCTTYLSLPGVQAVVNEHQDKDKWDALAGRYSFLEYASQQVLHHANAAAVVISQDDFLSQFFASAGIWVINLFEKFKARRYGSGATPLYILADKGLENLVRTRMKGESAAYVPGERYEYPLFAALASGCKGAVAALLGLPSITCDGVDITEGLKHRKDLTEYKRRTPLSWAAQEGRLGIVKALLERGADPNESDRIGCKPLIQALRMGHKAVAQLLIDSGADVNAQGQCEWTVQTALMQASMKGHKAIAQLLIDSRADVNAQQKDGRTALIQASQRGHEAVAQLLIDSGADVNAQEEDRRTALIQASQRGHEAVAQLLIDSGADVNAQEEDGCTALIWASQRGHEAVAQLLIDSGADINAQGKCRLTVSTALIQASLGRHEAIAQLLIDSGADVNVQSKYGQTALIYASEYGREAVAQLLIDSGADVNVQDRGGWTALIRASLNGHEAVVQLLIDSGADVNVQTKNGETALMQALENRHEAVARLLIDNRAEVNAQEEDRCTALI